MKSVPHAGRLIRSNSICRRAARAACEPLEGRRLLAIGALDPTFASVGYNFTNREIADVAVQSDGKVVVTGTENGDFFVARFTTTGSLDSTFGGGTGLVKTDLGGAGRSDQASSVVIQSDGKIVVAGYWENFTNFTADWELARYTIGGQLDSTFGAGGKVVLNRSGTHSHWLTSAGLQSDGKIVVAGQFDDNDVSSVSGDMSVARFTTAGVLDSTFGNGGQRFVDFYGAQDLANAMTILPDNKILTFGRILGAGSGFGEMGIVRWTSAGQPDNTFATGGLFRIGRSGREIEGLAVLAQPDGKIVMAGYSGPGSNSDLIMVRMNGDATNDFSFGSLGWVINDRTASGWERITDITRDANGNIVLCGSTGSDLFVARYTPTGQPDNTFGTGGFTALNISGTNETFHGVALAPDGRIVAGGETQNTGIAARFIASDSNAAFIDGTGTLIVPGSSGGDVVSAGTDLAGTTYTVTINGSTSTFPAANVQRVQIDLLGGDDQLTVPWTNEDNYTVNLGAGNDYLDLPNGNVPGTLTVNAGTELDTIHAVTPSTGQLQINKTLLEWSGSPIRTVAYSGIELLRVDGRSSNDDVLVKGTSVSTVLELLGGDDNVQIGANSAVPAIDGSLSIDGGTGTADTIGLENRSDINGRTYTITGSSMSRSGWAANVSFNSVESTSMLVSGINETLNYNGPLSFPFYYVSIGGASTLNVNSGTWSVDSDLGSVGAQMSVIVKSGATLAMSASQTLQSINVQSGGVAMLGAAGNRVIVTKAISLLGTLDIANNDLILDYSGAPQATAVRALINSARAGGAWTGPGLTSTSAKNAIPKNTTLGVLESSEFKTIYGPNAAFAGKTIDTTAVLVKYTYYGDVDFNGVVDFDDYSRIDAGFNNNRTGWLNGDVDGNGIIDFDDYSLIDQAFNTQGGPLRSAGAGLPDANKRSKPAVFS